MSTLTDLLKRASECNEQTARKLSYEQGAKDERGRCVKLANELRHPTVSVVSHPTSYQLALQAGWAQAGHELARRIREGT